MTDQQQQQPAPPATPAEATARLAIVRGDPAFGAKLFAGDVETTKEFNRLHELAAKGDHVDHAMAGVVVGDNSTTEQKQMTATADMLRDLGFPQLAIRETITGKEASQADVDRARVWKAQALRNPEFTENFLAGHPDAVREMMAANIVLSSNVKKEAVGEISD